MSEPVKKLLRTAGEKRADDVHIDFPELRRACLSGMTQMLCEGFQFARLIVYDEVSQLIPPVKLPKMGMGTVKFCEVDEQLYTTLRPFHREHNFNEAHSCIYLVKHGKDSGVDHAKMNKSFSDARGKGRMPDARMRLYNFAMHVAELRNTFPLVDRLQGGRESKMEIRGTLMAFNYPNVFLVYHKQVTGKQPKLMQDGLTMGSQDRFHRAVTGMALSNYFVRRCIFGGGTRRAGSGATSPNDR